MCRRAHTGVTAQGVGAAHTRYRPHKGIGKTHRTVPSKTPSRAVYKTGAPDSSRTKTKKFDESPSKSLPSSSHNTTSCTSSSLASHSPCRDETHPESLAAALDLQNKGQIQRNTACQGCTQMSLILPRSTHYLNFDRLRWPVTKRLDMNVELVILGLINS